MARAFKPLAVALARAISDKKAEEVSLLHVGRTSPVADFLLIATVNSRPHLEAVEVETVKAARDLRLTCLRRARPQSDQWRVLDFGGVLVHLMTAESRAFYALEKLYHDSPRVSWESANGRESKAAPARPRSHRPKIRSR